MGDRSGDDPKRSGGAAAGKHDGRSGRGSREERLAAALRENLRRRKGQARARTKPTER